MELFMYLDLYITQQKKYSKISKKTPKFIQWLK